MNGFPKAPDSATQGLTPSALNARRVASEAYNHDAGWRPVIGQAAANNFTNQYWQRTAAARLEAERRVEAATTQFQEESLNRGFGMRRPAPIRSEELKVKTYLLGYRFALVLAVILGFSNASQAVDLAGLEMPLAFKLLLVGGAVLFTLLAFKAIAKTYLTAAVKLDPFQNRGEQELNRWFKRLGLLFAVIAIPSLFLRMDTGFPEALGVVFWVAWEFSTVMIAALAALGQSYYAWSGELAEQYETALAEWQQA